MKGAVATYGDEVRTIFTEPRTYLVRGLLWEGLNVAANMTIDEFRQDGYVVRVVGNKRFLVTIAEIEDEIDAGSFWAIPGANDIEDNRPVGNEIPVLPTVCCEGCSSIARN